MKTVQTLYTNTVQNAAKTLHLNERQLLELYYNTGLTHIEHLKQAIKRKRTFDRMFKPFADDIGNMDIVQVFEMIEYSQTYWFYWASMWWVECRCGGFNTINELIEQLDEAADILPYYVLKNIIYEKRNIRNSRGVSGRALAKITDKKGEVTKTTAAMLRARNVSPDKYYSK